MAPSVGRIVHFYRQMSDVHGVEGPFAAIVTRAYDEIDQPADLIVFAFQSVARSEIMVSVKEFNENRYWEWPPRDAAPAPAVIDPKALPAPAVPEAVILSGYVPAIEFEGPNERADTLAEIGISQAMSDVEAMGAHPWLTDAVVLLTKAREKVANYIDRISPQPARPPAPLPDDTPPFQRERDAASEPPVDDTGEDIDPSLRA